MVHDDAAVGLDGLEVVFDDERVVFDAGIVLVATLARWPGGARREGGVSLVCGSCTAREKASVDTATGVEGLRGRERERANGGNRRH